MFVRRGAATVIVVVTQLHVDAVWILRTVRVIRRGVASGKGKAAIHKAGCAQMVPDDQFLVRAAGIWGIDAAIAIALRAGYRSTHDVDIS